MLLLLLKHLQYYITEKTANDTCSNIGECGGKLICQDGVCQCPVNLFLNGNKCISSKLHICIIH